MQKGVSEKFHRYQFPTLSIGSVAGDFASVNIKMIFEEPRPTRNCIFSVPSSKSTNATTKGKHWRIGGRGGGAQEKEETEKNLVAL